METAFLEIAVGFSLLITIHIIINTRFFFLSTDANHASRSSFDILIPARNEESSISACLQSAKTQLTFEGSQILVFDDNSSDQTPSILRTFADERLQILTNDQDPPHGWLGKNWACHQLVQASSAEYLVFLDADVILTHSAVPQVISVMQRHSLDLVSPYPRQISKGMLGNLIQPLLQWSWLATVPLALARKSGRASLAVANGQFMVVRREAYLASDGHRGVKDKVLDDIELLRLLLKHGFHGSVLDGTNLATCTMYRNSQELISGYAKSLWCAFGGLFGSIATVGFLLFIYVSPMFGFFNGHSQLAILGWASGFLGRLVTDFKTGHRNIISALLHPVSIFCFAYLNVISWWRHTRNELFWKGRRL